MVSEAVPIELALLPGPLTWNSWPDYEAAELGFHNYWYPVMWSRSVGKKPVSVRLLGEKIVFVRDRGTVRALHDRCPHRGVPLSLGACEFEGTITCPYHGWTYDLASGVLAAVITDGPDSPITGKVAVKTYPVEERLGLIWVFIGDLDDPPPLDADLPPELVVHPSTVCGKITPGRSGNWRYAAENGFDEGHAKFLHRNSLWAWFRESPVWAETEIVESEDGRWLSRSQKAVHWDAEFPGLGPWTAHRWWKIKKVPSRPADRRRRLDPVIAQLDLPGVVSIRAPSILRVAYGHFIHYEWAVPEDSDHHRYFVLLVSFKRRWWQKLRFRLLYYAYIRWALHTQFTGQDEWMVNVTDVPPERLYRPDASIIAYRRLVETGHRGRTATAGDDGSPPPGEQ